MSMDSIMNKQSVFSGVGAAHLPGEKGMINLLVQKGYKVRPVVLNKDLDSEQKEKVEKIQYPVSFTTFTDPDSIFTVEVPGRMYEVAKTKSYKYYLYPDMVNGCFYLVMTVQNYGALLGIKPNDYSKKLDSLLFENIPGKILQKTPFTTSNGLAGYDIENVTKRGDHQLYKIIFTPNQLIVVKVIGNDDYAKGADAQRFFKSIKLHSFTNKTFKTQHFPECGVDLYMPNKIHKQCAESFNYRSYTNYIANGLDENNHQYVFMQSALFDFKELEEDTFELNMLVEDFCKEQNLKVKHCKLLLESYPAIQFTGKFKNTEVYGKMVVAQPYYYMLLTSAKDKNSEKFFNSLQLSAPEYTNTFSTFFDSTLYFKVNTIQLINQEKKYLAHYENKKSKSIKKEVEPKQYSFSRTHFYSSNYTKECVEVNAIWFSKYSNIMVPDSFWARRIRRYARYGDLIVKTNTQENRKDWYEANITLADTNTNQIIKHRLLLKGEMFYAVTSNSDSAHRSGKFINEFLSSFEPSDTTFGTSIFTSKAKQFFDDLYSSDEATRLGAKDALKEDLVSFFETDDIILLQNIKRPEFNGLNIEEKKTLIYALAPSKNASIHLELKKLYDRYIDSTDIQLAIVETLAREKTSACTKVLLDILINDTPQLENKEDASEILYPFYDSLELAQQLFPQILELTRTSEYKYAIHKLMAYGVYKKVFPTNFFEEYKLFLFKECRNELRRQFSNEKETSNGYSNSRHEIVNTKESPAERIILSNANTNSLGNAHLYALYILIDPYKEDPLCKQLMEKIQRLKPGNTKSIILSYLLSRGLNFPDSVLKPLASEAYARVNWYSNLNKYNLTKHFDPDYYSQKEFAYALAFGNQNLNLQEDTVKYIEKRMVGFKNHKGYAYFYKLKKKESVVYSIYCVGVFPQNGKEVILNDMLNVQTKKIEKGDTEKELIDDMVQKIRTINRSRSNVSYSYDY
jgi:hypothetical protein